MPDGGGFLRLFIEDADEGGAGLTPALSFDFTQGTMAGAVAGIFPTFTRATTKSIVDWEGAVRTILSGEVPINGLRRVRNTLTTSSEAFGNAPWTPTNATVVGGVADPIGGTSAFTLTATLANGVLATSNGTTIVGDTCVGSIWMRRRTGNGTVRIVCGPGGPGPDVSAALTANWQRVSVTNAAVDVVLRFSITLGTNGDAVDIWRAQAEIVTGQSNQNPSEYVSVGVLAAPFNGAGVDGVQYFPWLNGNTVAANVVTAGTGAAIPASGYGIGRLPVVTSNGSNFSTPDAVANRITGDLWCAVWLQPDNWAPAASTYIASKYDSTGNQRSWLFAVSPASKLTFTQSLDGTATTSYTSTVGHSQPNAVGMWVAFFRQSVSGNLMFFTSPDGVNWTQLGGTLATTAGALFNSTASVDVGSFGAAGGPGTPGSFFKMQIATTQGGTPVVSFNSADYVSGNTFVSSATVETWTLNGGAKVNKWPAGYQPEVQSTNLCIRSETFTSWTAIGTPAATDGVLRCGNILLSQLQDVDAATLDGYAMVCAFTGDAVKAISIHFAQFTSTSSVVRVRDTTGAADRLLATITWTSGIPTVTMTTGTLIGVFPKGNGVWRAEMLTTAVTAANTNQIEVYPATTSALAVANIGTAYFGGVQAENQTFFCTSYIPTTTVTVTRNKDQMVVSALGAWFNPNAGALVAKAIAPSDASANLLASINDGSTNNRIRLYAANSAVFLVTTAGVAQAVVSGSVVAPSTATKVAAAWAANDYVIVKDTVVGATDNAGTIPTVTQLEVAQEVNGSQFNGLLQGLDYYNFRVANADLARLAA